jgi:hypothetical protein
MAFALVFPQAHSAHVAVHPVNIATNRRDVLDQLSYFDGPFSISSSFDASRGAMTLMSLSK